MHTQEWNDSAEDSYFAYAYSKYRDVISSTTRVDIIYHDGRADFEEFAKYLLYEMETGSSIFGVFADEDSRIRSLFSGLGKKLVDYLRDEENDLDDKKNALCASPAYRRNYRDAAVSYVTRAMASELADRYIYVFGITDDDVQFIDERTCDTAFILTMLTFPREEKPETPSVYEKQPMTVFRTNTGFDMHINTTGIIKFITQEDAFAAAAFDPDIALGLIRRKEYESVHTTKFKAYRNANAVFYIDFNPKDATYSVFVARKDRKRHRKVALCRSYDEKAIQKSLDDIAWGAGLEPFRDYSISDNTADAHTTAGNREVIAQLIKRAWAA